MSTNPVHEATVESAAESQPPARRRRRVVTVTYLLLAVPFVAWSALSLVDLDTTSVTAALVALTPYATAVGVLLSLLGLILRRWLSTLMVCVVTATLVLSVAPRAIPNSPVPTQGTALRVLSTNLYVGQADARRLVDLVRRNRVDVLSMQELTPEMVRKLDHAGLRRLLPHRVLHAHSGGEGSGIASRYPLRELSLVPPTTLSQPSARIEVPGARDVEFVAVHPSIPLGNGATDRWNRELTVLPDPAVDRDRPRVLAGDFNATLDHTPLQGLLGHGYVDAAGATGDGLRPTWPMRGRSLPPLLTLDHVLVSGGVAVQEYAPLDVPGTDHRAILAHLLIPRGR